MRSENVRHNFRVSAVALFLIIATGFVSRVESRTKGLLRNKVYNCYWNHIAGRGWNV
jgi:hypothetical protein